MGVFGPWMHDLLHLHKFLKWNETMFVKTTGQEFLELILEPSQLSIIILFWQVTWLVFDVLYSFGELLQHEIILLFC